jgi:hypothetical protein
VSELMHEGKEAGVPIADEVTTRLTEIRG